MIQDFLVPFVTIAVAEFGDKSQLAALLFIGIGLFTLLRALGTIWPLPVIEFYGVRKKKA